MTDLSKLIEMATEERRQDVNRWLYANCGKSIPHGEAKDAASMLHGLAYVLRQIEGTNSYRPNIGQTVAAASALRLALDHFALTALQSKDETNVEGV